jgi:hypothetical protein
MIDGEKAALSGSHMLKLLALPEDIYGSID